MGTRLYVGNLSYDTTEDTLRALFGADGRNVTDVHIVMDRETGRPRGFAFVEMASDADAKAAVQSMNGREVDGRTLKVDEAKERQGGGGGGG
ncbi:MAG: RNA-binding protein, partial [Myxococcales bacterium]|nr:RNA-binding protein [Myxococcales bacterium]